MARKSEKGDVIEGVIGKGATHERFLIGDTATKIPTPPAGCVGFTVWNDSGKFLRHGGPNVVWEALTGTPVSPLRGGFLQHGKGFSLGIADEAADKVYFIAETGQTADTVIEWWN